MEKTILQRLPAFLSQTGLTETPMGVIFADREPEGAFTPAKADLPTREKEMANVIDWPSLFGNFSCAIGHIWRARKKQGSACFSAEQFGCPGCAFWMGFNKPQVETIVHYVSTGIPGHMEGEFYCDSPDALRDIFTMIDPVPAPKPYCVFKPLDQFEAGETPLLVVIFARPESLCGIHQLATFITRDPETVASPWSAACGSIIAWPMHYLAREKTRVVLGGWDPSARKYFKGDELSLTVPYTLFADMVRRYEESFLMTDTWQIVQKKIARSRKTWGD